MVRSSTINKNCQDVFERTPRFLKAYADYLYPPGKNYNNSFYRKIIEIERFLAYYQRNYYPEIDFKELGYSHLEHLPLEVIESYFNFLKTKESNKKTILSTLSSFWSYFTIYSFSLEKGKPIFYRNAFDEWRIGYPKTYQKLTRETTRTNNILYTAEQLSEFLDFYDNSFILFLDTIKKVKNFRIKKDRDLAAMALLMGTGITVEELSHLTIKNIDMRKKKISFMRDDRFIEIPIMSFACPYISPYVTFRRQLFVDNGRVPELFLGKHKTPMGPTSFTNLIAHLSRFSKKPLSSLIIRNSYQYIIGQTNQVNKQNKVNLVN